MSIPRRSYKLLAVLALLALLLPILAACGGTPAANETPGDNNLGNNNAQATQPVSTSVAPVSTEAPATTDPTEEPVQAEPTAQATVGTGTTPTAGVGGQGNVDPNSLLTVSQEQQATWVRNFNPFAPDVRWPTLYGIYEPLMVFNAIKGELVPWLATGYEWGEGNKTLTFTVRDGVQWSDGTPFTAKDVAFTFNLMKKTPGLAGVGAGAMAEGGYIGSVEATDDRTVVFTFSRVYTPGLHDLAQQNIVPEHVWTNVEDPLKFTNAEGDPVATGPFTHIARFNNQYWELHRNPNYWQKGKPAFQGFRFPSYPGNEQANLATIGGKNDWAGNFIPDIEKVYVKKDPQNHHYWFPSTGDDVMLYLNTTKKPFDDPNVRKAISMAINRQQIVKVAMFSYTHPADATGLSDRYEPWKNQEAVQAGKWVPETPNIAEANRLLDAAGLQRSGNTRMTADGKPMQYEINVVTGWTDWVQSVQIIAQNLKAVGIEATVKPYDFSAWFDRVQKGDFDISIGWSSGGATPFNFYRGVMSTQTWHKVGEVSGENWHRYKNAEADKLLEQFAATSDEEEQRRISGELQTLFVQNAPAIPLFPGPQWYEFNTKRFTGFPSEEDPYAIGSTYANERLIVMTNIRPK